MNNYKMKKGGPKDRIVGATDKAGYGKIMSKGGPVKTLRASALRRCRKTK